MKYLSIPISVLLLSLSGHNAIAHTDAEDIDAKEFTKKLKRNIGRYNLEISIFTEKIRVLLLRFLKKLEIKMLPGPYKNSEAQGAKRNLTVSFLRMWAKNQVFYVQKKLLICLRR